MKLYFQSTTNSFLKTLVQKLSSGNTSKLTESHPLDFTSLALSILFLVVGTYLCCYLPLSIKRKIEKGEEPAEAEEITKWTIPCGILISGYCIVDIVISIVRSF